MTRPSVLCPVDFRDPSRGALRYAAALAEHFYATLTVLTVNDPVASDIAVFVDDVFGTRRPLVPELRLETANGLPATEILRVVHDTGADVIVMSSHGSHSPRTMLGSVTERVLRDTKVPVIITPPADPGPRSLEDWKRSLKTILVPVDLSSWTPRQVAIARGLGEAVGAQLVFMHVLADNDNPRRLAAHAALDRIIHETAGGLRPSMTLAVGDPATQIARVASARAANVILVGLHTSPERRNGMGHVTYSVLCQTPTLVVAWPPTTATLAKSA